jgi:chromosome segregation ATPase
MTHTTSTALANTNANQQALSLNTNELTALYQDRFAAYSKELHQLSAKIQQLQKEIRILVDAKSQEELAFSTLEREVEAELKILTRLNEQYLKKAEVIIELRRLTQESNAVIEARVQMIDELLEEIEEVELLLLQKELECQNRRLELAPKREAIVHLEHQINTLEAQKQYLESAGVHHITHPTLPTHSTNQEENFIETEIED